MVLYRFEYWAEITGQQGWKSSYHPRITTIVEQDNLLFKACKKIRDEYKENIISNGGRFSPVEYLINGGVVTLSGLEGERSDRWLRLTHETQEGLEVLAKRLDLFVPVTAPVGANTSSEII